MANHSSILAWKIPWTEEPGRLQAMGPKESDITEELSPSFTSFKFPLGNLGFICVTPMLRRFRGLNNLSYGWS